MSWWLMFMFLAHESYILLCWRWINLLVKLSSLETSLTIFRRSPSRCCTWKQCQWDGSQYRFPPWWASPNSDPVTNRLEATLQFTKLEREILVYKNEGSNFVSRYSYRWWKSQKTFHETTYSNMMKNTGCVLGVLTRNVPMPRTGILRPLFMVW